MLSTPGSPIPNPTPSLAPSRRAVLRAAGGVAAGIVLWRQTGALAGVPCQQLHLQFGSDASREMTVSWVTPVAVKRPRLRFGEPRTGGRHMVEARTEVTKDSRTGRRTLVHHARLTGLRPGRIYVYEVGHDGALVDGGTFRTAPSGRAPLRFTSFGDQGVGPTAQESSVWALYLPAQIEAMRPLFNLHNGDLAYSDLAEDRPSAWDKFFTINERSMRNRPWMPSLGNHENELGNGELGFDPYRTRYGLPGNGSRDYHGLWYSFKAGSVLVVSLDNNDACYQDGGDLYLRGYSSDAQRAWLERTLAKGRKDPDVDWIVVTMHQLALSSALANGSDLGVRQAWLDLFDRYGVDLVLGGHDHAYERSHLVRGFEAGSPTRKPLVVSDAHDNLDATKGGVHLVVGTGGAAPIKELYYLVDNGVPVTGVIVDRGVPSTVLGDDGAHTQLGLGGVLLTGLTSNRLPETCEWSNVRKGDAPYGFVSVDVDPGASPRSLTRLVVSYYLAAPSYHGKPTLFDRFVLHRPRGDRA